MNKNIRIAVLSLAGFGVFLASPKPVLADFSLAPLFQGSPTLIPGVAIGLLLTLFVILIEAAVIRNTSQASWRTSLLTACVANLVSVIIGGVFWHLYGKCALVFLLLIPLSIAAVFFVLASVKQPGNIAMLLAVIFISIYFGSHGLLMLEELPWVDINKIRLCFFLHFLLGFGLSLGIELPLVKTMLSNKKAVKTVLLMNLCSYTFLIIVAPFTFPNPIEQAFGWDKPIPAISHSGARDFYELWAFEVHGGEATFNAGYRRAMTTPQVLGIIGIRHKLKPFDEYRTVEIASKLFAERSYSLYGHRYGFEELMIYIRLSLEKYDLSEDAETELKHLQSEIQRLLKTETTDPQ